MILLKTLHRIVFSFAFLFFPLASYTFSGELPGVAGAGLETTSSIEDELKWLQAETFVWGASKYEQKVSEAPSSVTIITANEIKKFGFRTLAEMLRTIRGFFVTYDRNWYHLGTRGLDRPGDFNSRILLLIDGHRVNDPIFGGALIDSTFILNIDNVDRVEVIRGPSSSLYGTSAFFGVINVITKSSEDLKGVEVAGEYGRWNTYRGRMSYSHQFKNGGGILVSGSVFDSQGQEKLFYKEFDSPDTNNGIAENADADKNHRFFTKISFHDFTFHSAYSDRTKNVPTAAYETVFNDSRFKTVEKQTYVEMKYAHEFGKELDLDARIFYDRYQFDADYPFEEVLNQDYALGQLWGSELRLTKTFLERHKIIAGVEYEDFFNQDQTNGDVGAPELFLDAKKSSEVWAFYLQDEFDILDNLTLNAGVRYDHYSTFGSTTNPRAALIYNPFDETVVKFLFGQAFRSPNAFEFYYDDGESQKANTELEPETIKTYELILEQELGENLRGTVSGFFYTIKDLISQQVDPADDLAVFKNIDEVEAKGIELELSGKWERGIMGKISYSFQETEDKTTGKILTNSPRNLFKYKLSVPFMQEKIFAGIEGRYTGKRKTEGGNEESGYFVTNLTIFSESLVSGLEVSGSIYNLFNTTYSDPGTAGVHTQDVIEQDGIDYRLKLLYKF